MVKLRSCNMKQNKKTNKINTKNTPYLIIVESPSKCKKIEKILGFYERRLRRVLRLARRFLRDLRFFLSLEAT